MNFEPDIEKRIIIDFGNKASEVFAILKKAINNFDYLKSNRIIRCIIFLAEKDIVKLNQNIEAAILDPRDVMFWAEYENQEEFGKERRVRDFNKSFDYSEIEM